MTAGRFTVIEQPGNMRPTFLVVDMHRPVAAVVFTAQGEGALDRCEFLAAELSEADAAHALPPVFDLPGAPSESPF